MKPDPGEKRNHKTLRSRFHFPGSQGSLGARSARCSQQVIHHSGKVLPKSRRNSPRKNPAHHPTTRPAVIAENAARPCRVQPSLPGADRVVASPPRLSPLLPIRPLFPLLDIAPDFIHPREDFPAGNGKHV
ncbi:hypothetical protein ZHAS_00004448 [Anopheles sinensis]|uniref:Uncharacterized protein n=1 Tax=Anopheles sinensis TaxID=74873 RepID=A0A084VGY9_ANOSI|nr:hypothetical protein ZHAS_00004448 [Anopheles sinensis]